jgi:hypothetical protein
LSDPDSIREIEDPPLRPVPFQKWVSSAVPACNPGGHHRAGKAKVAGVVQILQMPAIAHCAPGFSGWGRMNQQLDRAFLVALMAMGAAYLILFGCYFFATMIRRPYGDMFHYIMDYLDYPRRGGFLHYSGPSIPIPSIAKFGCAC